MDRLLEPGASELTPGNDSNESFPAPNPLSTGNANETTHLSRFSTENCGKSKVETGQIPCARGNALDESFVSVASQSHPFKAAVADIAIPEGRTLAEIIEIAQPDKFLRGFVHAEIDGTFVTPAWWHRVKPKAGHIVTLSVVPEGGGGGKNPLRTLLTIAVIVAAVYAGPAVGAFLSGTTVAGVSATFSALGTAVVSLGGMLLVDMIAPIKAPSISRAQNEAESPSYFLDSARNVARPYAPVPIIFGKHRVVPPLGGAPFTEVMGDHNHLRMLVVWGYGPLKISDLKIGDTPIEDFEDYRLETLEGRDTDEPLTIYANDVDQQNFSINLTNENVTDPEAANPPAGDWVSRRTADNADEISVDISLPKGLSSFNDQGKRQENDVSIQIQFREVGTTIWRTPTFSSTSEKAAQTGSRSPDNFQAKWVSTSPARSSAPEGTFTLTWDAVSGATSYQVQRQGSETIHDVSGTSVDFRNSLPSWKFRVRTVFHTGQNGSWSNYIGNGQKTRSTVRQPATTGGQIDITASRTKPIRYGYRWSTGERAQYDVRVRRVTPNEADRNREHVDRHFSDTVWVALRTITNEPPYDFPENLAVTAIDIRASEQLDRAVDNLNAIVEAEVLDWNGSSWAAGYSRNPASLFRHALQTGARRKSTPDSEIDLDALQDWHDFCETNGYHFDYIQDVRRSIWDVLSDICAAGRASPARIDDKWSVIVDDGAQRVRQHFTPLNSSGFELTRAFEPPPHGLKISFPNEKQNWSRDERIVYRDEFSDANATIVPDLNPIGITDPDHIYKWGRFHLAQILLRRERWSFVTGFENLVARRGSRVTVQHDVLVVGEGSARVIAVTKNSNARVTGLDLDVGIHLPSASATYAAKIRTVDDANIVANITEKGDTVESITFVSPLASGDDVEIGALISLGESGRVTTDGLVTLIERESDLRARVTLVPYQPGVYSAETGVIPPFDSGIVARLRAFRMVIISVNSGPSQNRRIGDVFLPGITVEVRPVQEARAVIETQIKLNGTDEPYAAADVRSRTRDSVEIGGVETGSTYDIRLRWNVPGEKTSNWAERTAITVSTFDADPITDFSVSDDYGGVRIYTWTKPDALNFAGVKIRYADSDAEWEDMTELHDGVLATSPHYDYQPGVGTWYFEIRSVSKDDEESEGKRIRAILGAPPRSGTDFEEIEVYRVVNAGATAPVRPTDGSYDFSERELTPPTGWSAPPFPTYSRTQVVYSSTATADRSEGDTWTPDSDDWSVPVIAGDADDLNIIYRRFATAPTTAPTASTGVPTGWYDVVANVPDGANPIYISVGVRRRGSSTYTWGVPTQLEGQDGVSRKELTAYRKQTATANPPSRPGASGSYVFSTSTFTPPSGWVADWPGRTNTESVYAVVATAVDQDSANTRQDTWNAGSNSWIGPIEISADSDLKVIYRRTTGTPSEPANSAGIPSGWYDRVSSVPLGSGLLWLSVGIRVRGTRVFDWQTPSKVEGEDGVDGETVVGPKGDRGEAGPAGPRIWQKIYSVGRTVSDNEWNTITYSGGLEARSYDAFAIEERHIYDGQNYAMFRIVGSRGAGNRSDIFGRFTTGNFRWAIRPATSGRSLNVLFGASPGDRVTLASIWGINNV